MTPHPIPDGEAFSKGDTVGFGTGDRFPVRYVESPVEPGKKVWRVELSQ